MSLIRHRTATHDCVLLEYLLQDDLMSTWHNNGVDDPEERESRGENCQKFWDNL